MHFWDNVTKECGTFWEMNGGLHLGDDSEIFKSHGYDAHI